MSATVLAVEHLRAGYGGKQVLTDVSLTLERGQIAALLGHNGAGKTTAFKAIVGLIPAVSGHVWLNGVDITRNSCFQNVKRGLVFLPQERAVFGQLSVRDNLLLGANATANRLERQTRLDRVLEMFPVLRERWGQTAATLSGGQQRILSIGIALMAGARVLLLDEPSLGLAPTVAQSLIAAIKELVERDGLSVLLVEQNVALALQVAERISVMRMGQIVAEEHREDMLAREKLWELF